jgi:hypothetical protein
VNWFEKDYNSNYADAGTLHVDLADIVNERFKAWSFLSVGKERVRILVSQAREDSGDPKKLFNSLLR